MGITRRIVFPALRIIIWAIIAVALVMLVVQQSEATNPDGQVDPEQPYAEFDDPLVSVTTQTLTNAVTVDATVVTDAATQVRSTGAGAVHSFALADGVLVEQGAPLLVVRQEQPRDPIEQTDEDGNVTFVDQYPLITDTTVRATQDGVVRFTVLEQENVEVGSPVAQISPGTHSVVADLAPEQQYRLTEEATSAEVTINGGPAPFECEDFALHTPTEDDDAPADGTGVQARCLVPDDVTVFPGLSGKLAITTGQATDALVLPVTAVQGSYEQGNVWVVDGADEPVEHAVTLGMTDGQVIQILDGLDEGDEVLEFIPIGAPATPEELDPEIDSDDGFQDDTFDDDEADDDGADDGEIADEG